MSAQGKSSVNGWKLIRYRSHQRNDSLQQDHQQDHIRPIIPLTSIPPTMQWYVSTTMVHNVTHQGHLLVLCICCIFVRHEKGRWNENILLWTPFLDNTSQKTLFRIVSYIGPDSIYDSSKIIISTSDNFRLGHSWLQGLEDHCEGHVDKLPTKFVKLAAIGMLFFGWKWNENVRKDIWGVNEHFGIAKKPSKTRPFRWARQVVLWIFLIDRYIGQYSLLPVATETVVLLLPRMMGTNIAPWLWVSGSLLIISCRIVI